MILPPSRMWSDWSRTCVPLLFPTLPEIWHSVPTTSPPRSVHPSAKAARAGRKMSNAATMTRGIDNRLMVFRAFLDYVGCCVDLIRTCLRRSGT